MAALAAVQDGSESTAGRGTQHLLPSFCATVSAAALIGALAGCGSSAMDPSAATIVSISVSPDSVSLAIGSSDNLSARAHTGSGTSLSRETFYWSTSDSQIATVTQSGVVEAISRASHRSERARRA